MKIEAIHDFHDEDYAREWGDRFTPTEHRMDMFQTMLNQLNSEFGNTPIQLLELGTGPGYLAQFILEKLKDVRYVALDFSLPMLKLAAEKLNDFRDKMQYVQIDLTEKHWSNKIAIQPDAIISTWALHDLYSMQNIKHVYTESFKILKDGGTLINSDFIKPAAAKVNYEGGRITITEHLGLLQAIGYTQVSCVKQFETSVAVPTTANNYACIMAKKSLNL